LYDKVVLRISTNKNTLRNIRKQPYKLTIHNGFEFKTTIFEFKDDLNVTKYIDYNDLFTGINILTVFNDNNMPILERMFFKYDGINFTHTNEAAYKKSADSVEVSVPFKDVNLSLPNHFSISVLPQGTKSYSHHHNIISSTYLQPYVNGFIENARYYFTDINRRKQYELDNLLLTQGWSSYDWNKIFNYLPNTSFEFETGISFKATVNKSNTADFVMYPTSYNNLEIFQINNENNSFEKRELFPFDGENIRLSEIKKNEKVKKTGIYLQFYPSKIPDIENHSKNSPLKQNVFYDSNDLQPFLETSWTEFEQLDEVLIEVNKNQERIDKLQNTTMGDIDVFDDSKRRMTFDLASYLRTKGFRVFQDFGTLTITNPRASSFRASSPMIYLNNRLIEDTAELSYYGLDLVDYIIINKRGYGEGARGAGGVIKIFTDPTLLYKNNPELSNFEEIDIPLSFSTPTAFYAPKYNNYDSNFYREYGVINWLPKLSVDNNSKLSFKMSNVEGSNIKICIEGTANNGSFISEIKTIKIK